MNQPDWVATMARAAGGLDTMPFGLAVVDPTSGAIAYHNPALKSWVGEPVPATVGEVDEMELISQADREALAALTRTFDDRDSCASLPVTVIAAGAPPEDATVHVAHLHAVQGDGRVVIVVITPRHELADRPAAGASPWELGFLWDADGVVVATDERMLDLGMDPDGLIGGHAFVFIHPADVPLIAPVTRAILVGDILEADYTVRAVAPAGGWTNVHIHLCRIHGHGPRVFATVSPTDDLLDPIEPGQLTPGELEVTRILFAGRSVADIAELRGVSVHTVRNQVRSIYEKLTVTSVAELTSRYSLPLRPAPPRIRMVRSPRR